MIIYSDGTKFGDIDIYYASWHHLGTIRQPLFENEPLRFYTAPEFGAQPFGVVLENREQKIVEETSSILLSVTKDSQEFLPNSDLKTTLNHLTLNSLQETAPFVSAIRWSE